MKSFKTLSGETLTIAKHLLSKGTTNAKLSKNELESFILYLTPSRDNSKGIDLCTSASDICRDLCLYTAGRGRFNSVSEARIRRTEFYLHDRNGFLEMLINELTKLNARALRLGGKIAVRLNGTSDLDFIAIIKNRFGIDILETYPELEFYDYTKHAGKITKYAGTRYKLTFSRTETNDETAREMLKFAPVAVVFDHTKPFPAYYLGAPVIDGDASDDQMLNLGAGIILGLKAKGRAKKDFNGFVVR
jgi:hypothetical protein